MEINVCEGLCFDRNAIKDLRRRNRERRLRLRLRDRMRNDVRIAVKFCASYEDGKIWERRFL